MRAHSGMKIQIPQKLGLPQITEFPHILVLTPLALFMQRRCGPASSSVFALLSTPRLGFLPFGLQDQMAYACGSHSGLPGRRKTALSENLDEFKFRFKYKNTFIRVLCFFVGRVVCPCGIALKRSVWSFFESG